MKKIKKNITHKQLLSKLDEILALAKRISQESALFHKEHNHKKPYEIYK